MCSSNRLDPGIYLLSKSTATGHPGSRKSMVQPIDWWSMRRDCNHIVVVLCHLFHFQQIHFYLTDVMLGKIDERQVILKVKSRGASQSNGGSVACHKKIFVKGGCQVYRYNQSVAIVFYRRVVTTC